MSDADLINNITNINPIDAYSPSNNYLDANCNNGSSSNSSIESTDSQCSNNVIKPSSPEKRFRTNLTTGNSSSLTDFSFRLNNQFPFCPTCTYSTTNLNGITNNYLQYLTKNNNPYTFETNNYNEELNKNSKWNNPINESELKINMEKIKR